MQPVLQSLSLDTLLTHALFSSVVLSFVDFPWSHLTINSLIIFTILFKKSKNTNKKIKIKKF